MCYLKIDDKRISTPLLDIVVRIRSDLQTGKLKKVEPKPNNIRVTCPHHKNGLESTAAADIYIGPDIPNVVEYGWFKCFVCGEQGPFYHFVAECFDASDEWAKEWLINNFADGLIEYELDLPTISLEKEVNHRLDLIDENVLEGMENFHPYMTTRKLSKEVIDKFEIKYEPSSKCLVFPVRDDKGKLLMLTRRSVEDKTFIIDKEKEKPVYLLYYLKQHNISSCIITESQINALTCHSYHLPAVALFGTGSKFQWDILNKSSILYYILCFDGDAAGNAGIQKFLKNIKKNVIVDIVKMPSGKDVNDLSKDQFLALLKNNLIDVTRLQKEYETKCINN